MTIPDKSLGSLGKLRIGGGYGGKIPRRDYDYPKERLQEVLNFSSKNVDEIIQFCSDYQIIHFSFSEKEIAQYFLKEQAKLKRIAKKLENNQLKFKDLGTINNHLHRIKLEVGLATQSEIGGIENMPDAIKQKFTINQLMLIKRHPDTITSLWEELVRRFVEKQDIKECVNCGDYFVLNSKHERKFCDKQECKDAHSKRQRRAKKKLVRA